MPALADEAARLISAFHDLAPPGRDAPEIGVRV
jgi:hypothetical protein